MKRTLCTVLTALTLATALPAMALPPKQVVPAQQQPVQQPEQRWELPLALRGDWRQARLGQPLLSPPLRLPA